MNLRRILYFCALLMLGGVPASAQTASDLFSSQVLHDVFLRMNTRDLEILRAAYTENTYYPADLQWGDTVVANVAIRSRGRATRSAEKLGLRIDLDHFVRGQTLVGLDGLVLDNLNQDPSMLHEHAAMALFTRLGFVAPRTGFARLFINDEYQGVYGLVEEPNENFVRSRFGEDKGYLFEYHWRTPYYFDDLGDDLDVYPAYFEARTHERDAPNTLYGPIRELVRAADGETLNEWRDRVSPYLDLAQFVRLVATEQFLSEFDGVTGHAGMNNFYLYRPRDSQQHIFIPWDRDSAFLDADSLIDLRLAHNRMLRQALAFPDLHALYLAQLNEAARVAVDDIWLEQVIKAGNALVSSAAGTDERRRFTADERAIAVQELLIFTRRRPYSVFNQVRQAATSRPGQ